MTTQNNPKIFSRFKKEAENARLLPEALEDGAAKVTNKWAERFENNDDKRQEFTNYLVRLNYDSAPKEIKELIGGFENEGGLMEQVENYILARSRYRKAADKHWLKNEDEEYKSARAEVEKCGEKLQQSISYLNLTPENRRHLATFLAVQEVVRGVAEDRMALTDFKDNIKDELTRLKEEIGADKLKKLLPQIFIRVTSTSHPTNFFGDGMAKQVESLYNLYESARQNDYGTKTSQELLEYLLNPGKQDGIGQIFQNFYKSKNLVWQKQIEPSEEIQRSAELNKWVSKHYANGLKAFNKVARNVLGEGAEVKPEQITLATWEGFESDGRDKENVQSLHDALQVVKDFPLGGGIKGRVGENRHNSGTQEDIFTALFELTDKGDYKALNEAAREKALKELIANGENLLTKALGFEPKGKGVKAYNDYEKKVKERLAATALKGDEKKINLVAHAIARMAYLGSLENEKGQLVDSYIIANYRNRSDFLEAMAIMKMTGNLKSGDTGIDSTRMEVIPLFEDAEGIESIRKGFNEKTNKFDGSDASENELIKLRDDDACASMMKAQGDLFNEGKPRLTTFFGYSDAGKNMSYSAAQFFLRHSQKIIRNLFGSDKYKFGMYFGAGWEAERHGSGFSMDNMLDAMSDWLGENLDFRFTGLQGDALRRFAISPAAGISMITTAITGLLRRHARFLDISADPKKQELDNQIDSILNKFAGVVRDTYTRDIVKGEETVKFITENGAWTAPNSSSRGQRNPKEFDGLRAIQVNLGTFGKGASIFHHGFTDALEKLINGELGAIEVGGKMLEKMELASWLYKNHDAFRNVLDTATNAAEMSDPVLASAYWRTPEAKANGAKYLENICAGHEKTRALAKQITGDDYPFRSKALRVANTNRAAFGVLAHFLQADTLKQLATDNDNKELKECADLTWIAIHEAYNGGLMAARGAAKEAATRAR